MRENWVNHLLKIAHPVLQAAANDNLKTVMPVANSERREVQYLEVLGRLFCGLAPWLNLNEGLSPNENQLKQTYKTLFCKSLDNLVNPSANDYTNFACAPQTLVDSAYLAQGFLRAPNVWEELTPEVKKRFLFEIKKTRSFKPPKNNWLLFAAIIEAFLLEYDNSYMTKRLCYGVKYFIKRCYIGDGFYGDGSDFAMDHYNSFVIQPMLTDILSVMVKHNLKNAHKYQVKHLQRYKRYIEIQERLISPEGTYPVVGRTLICRFGTFHALSQAALLQLLPKSISNAQVRCSLNAVLNQHMSCEANFDARGFMTIGFNGNQQQMAENYVSSGSPYHCATLFLPLGIAESHSFWNDGDEEWTSVKAFNGKTFLPDHAYHEINKNRQVFMPYLYKLMSGYKKLKRMF